MHAADSFLNALPLDQEPRRLEPIENRVAVAVNAIQEAIPLTANVRKQTGQQIPKVQDPLNELTAFVLQRDTNSHSSPNSFGGYLGTPGNAVTSLLVESVI